MLALTSLNGRLFAGLYARGLYTWDTTQKKWLRLGATANIAPLALAATDGTTVDLSALRGWYVVYAYPRTGRPDEAPPAGWDAIPGAGRVWVPYSRDLIASAPKVWSLDDMTIEFEVTKPTDGVLVAFEGSAAALAGGDSLGPGHEGGRRLALGHAARRHVAQRFEVLDAGLIAHVGVVTDDGLPNPPATVTNKWTVASGPAGASFADDTM